MVLLLRLSRLLRRLAGLLGRIRRGAEATALNRRAPTGSAALSLLLLLHHLLLLLHQLADAGGLILRDVVNKFPLLIFLVIVYDVNALTLRRARDSG